MEEIKVSVIIPFFGVERFVERCARALMEQTLPEVEFIFVDDASTDGSRSIIEHVCAQFRRNVTILTHSENLGLPEARNTGLAAAKGEWVWHCDSDDYPEPTMLEEMYKAATASGADFAYCDFYLDFGTGRRYMANPSYEDPVKMIKEGFLAGLMKYNVWNKLVRRSLYTGILFPKGHPMGEDMTMISVATRATRTVHVPKALYHYMKTNAGAFTNTMSEKHRVDILYNTRYILSVLSHWEVSQREQYLAFFKLGVKLPFLFTGKYADYRLWQKWFPEANAFIRDNRHLPRRTKWLQQCASWHLYPLVWLYSFAVNQLYYRSVRKAQ